MKTDSNSLAGLLLGAKTIHHPELGSLFGSLPTPPDRRAVVPSGATAPASSPGGGVPTFRAFFSHYAADRRSALNEF